jgi:muconolactone D-isomerase
MAKEKLVEFLINISFIGPVGWSEEDVAALVTRERAHAAELAREGYLVRGLWRARDATHMHEIISGLPFWPYMQLTIHPMASHPVDPLRFGA